MPRPLRPIAPGLVYHVVNRGNNRQNVFLETGDYEALLKALLDLRQHKLFALYGYCLMSNHFHLLIRPQQHSISQLMQSVLVSHTQRYHKHRQSLGHVWQGRFKSPVIEDDDHLLTVLQQRWEAYVEQTPDADELAAIRRSVERSLPFGCEAWVEKLSKNLELDLTIRPRDRPKKSTTEANK